MLPVPSEANRLKLPPSDTAKFTLASALLLCRAASKEAATPNTQKLSTVVFQMPPLSVRRSSSLVAVRLPLPAKRFTVKVVSNEPSGLSNLSPLPTRSLSLPLKLMVMLAGGAAGTVALAVAVLPSAKVIVRLKVEPGGK